MLFCVFYKNVAAHNKKMPKTQTTLLHANQNTGSPWLLGWPLSGGCLWPGPMPYTQPNTPYVLPTACRFDNIRGINYCTVFPPTCEVRVPASIVTSSANWITSEKRWRTSSQTSAEHVAISASQVNLNRATSHGGPTIRYVPAVRPTELLGPPALCNRTGPKTADFSVTCTSSAGESVIAGIATSSRA